MTLEEFEAGLKALEPDELKNMLERRHPDYAKKIDHWNFLEETYEGGRDWFDGNIFPYFKEGEDEYKARRARAYRFNHTREVVDVVNKYIFKAEINRRTEDAPQHLIDFWKESTLRRSEIVEFMKLASSKASIYGKVWAIVDSNKSITGGTVSEDKTDGYRVYTYVVKPQNALDMGFSVDGDLDWILTREFGRDDAQAWSSGATEVRYRLWTKNFWALFKEEEKKRVNSKTTYKFVEAGEHGLEMTPAFCVDHVLDEDMYSGQALIDDTAYLDRAVANYLSNLDAIIQDQTFSQLVVPAQAVLPGEDGHAKLMEMGTKRMFTYDAQANIAPTYISPDSSQAGVILSVIEKIISEIYHSTGMAGERTKQDNSMGIDNSSGVAKAYDFERMNAMLASKANALQKAEQKLMAIVSAYHSETLKDTERPLVEYPDNFDVRGLYDEFEIAQRLSVFGAPKMVRREQMKALSMKLFKTTSDADLKKMKAEIDEEWLEIDLDSPLTSQNEIPEPPEVEENRQGQVTEETP